MSAAERLLTVSEVARELRCCEKTVRRLIRTQYDFPQLDGGKIFASALAAWIRMNRRSMKPHFLYRHYDENGILLYVGESLNAVQRLSQHRKQEWYWRIATISVERFPARDEALYAEYTAIKNEKPVFNRKGK